MQVRSKFRNGRVVCMQIHTFMKMKVLVWINFLFYTHIQLYTHFSQIHIHYVIPSGIGFFAGEASWGKVITLDQLKQRGRALANRCCLCEEDEEKIDHLLIHCKMVRMLWDLFLSTIETSWVFPCSVIHTFLA